MYDEEHQTDGIVMDALTKIAKEDETDLEKLWQDGYTEKHSSEEVEVMVKTYIREVKPEDMEDRPFYNWGIEKIWVD
jgi:hypothetical protein